ncbi:hypothetical protein TWF225_005967 [Orbilia oligospora]|uniref:Uncharacterized protein n=1 Tax=Orbilia oligospora TaxID=2813651 RepID=A0A7C8KCU9_ORBOL|nr:hypothetical protein TWF102_010234 [Orbilia oligospora]KAF3127792.1 hypothetical protein TWF703_009840 [Orbilia oligospora]KAF3168665.1 hypothetical protein TWF751_007708 [Orbilia oligospora]KAF3184689.1 hypothetical protein TWF225_005967 [Orbilia oligospora]KAF3245959.1 hypothetical protein TWF128_009304 [Orbilia oligospora]
MCFKDSNVEYLDPPARQSSVKPEAPTILVPPSKNAVKEAKAAEKAAKKARREENAAIRRKMMYGPGGGAMYGGHIVFGNGGSGS